MSIIVDTSVFVSAVLKHDSVPLLVVCWIDERGGLLKSTAKRGGAAGRLAAALSCCADDPVVSSRHNQDAGSRRAGDDQRRDRGVAVIPQMTNSFSKQHRLDAEHRTSIAEPPVECAEGRTKM